MYVIAIRQGAAPITMWWVPCYRLLTWFIKLATFFLSAEHKSLSLHPSLSHCILGQDQFLDHLLDRSVKVKHLKRAEASTSPNSRVLLSRFAVCETTTILVFSSRDVVPAKPHFSMPPST